MGRYTVYQIVDGEIADDPPLRAAVQAMMVGAVLHQGLTPLSPMVFSWSERNPPVMFDPFTSLPWWRKALVLAGFCRRPPVEAIRQFGCRGVVEVAEDGPP